MAKNTKFMTIFFRLLLELKRLLFFFTLNNEPKIEEIMGDCDCDC